jgi:hypothetical protein
MAKQIDIREDGTPVRTGASLIDNYMAVPDRDNKGTTNLVSGVSFPISIVSSAEWESIKFCEVIAPNSGWLLVDLNLTAFTQSSIYVLRVRDSNDIDRCIYSENINSVVSLISSFEFYCEKGHKYIMEIVCNSISSTLNVNHIFVSFIPPKFQEIAGAHTSTDIGYSLAEQDTGTTWIDGKKIYKRTFVVDVATFTGTDIQIPLNNFTGVKQFVRMESFLIDKSAQGIYPANFFEINTSGTIIDAGSLNVHFSSISDVMYLIVRCGTYYVGWKDNNLVATVWYTKA